MSHYTGYVDYASTRFITGWAEASGSAAEVSFYVHGKKVGSVTGGLYRPDLANVGKNCEAGFLYEFKPALEDNTIVAAYFANGELLGQSPLTVFEPKKVVLPSLIPQDRNGSPLIYLHIPKVGGTSLHRLIDTHTPNRQSLYGVDITNPIFNNDFRCLQPRPKLVIGHLAFGAHLFLGEQPRYACMFREPVNRIISLYRYTQSFPNPLFAPFVRRSLAELTMSGYSEQMNNHMCRICAGIETQPGVILRDRWLLDLAIHNIEAYFEIIGILEKPLLFVESLGRVLDWPKLTLGFENLTVDNTSQNFDEMTLDIVREYNNLDIELYKFVEKRIMSFAVVN